MKLIALGVLLGLLIAFVPPAVIIAAATALLAAVLAPALWAAGQPAIVGLVLAAVAYRGLMVRGRAR
ncbi:hypothetical protein [Streptomyces sp. PH10-H1]|uniref:hypothetical protein n=1 Tax=Streptomyces sp. PH10-H1 TaxID=3046212 RepID=UPI0024BAB9C6|nr:hypothetical protein [Streptomyces sp. PH10-H1]MDJ0346748.1 hypothetical protein [Streptomyces sp. PH10-H1]